MNAYRLEKAVWDHTDFPVMGWHDARVWSMLVLEDAYEFVFDLDYIFNWVLNTAGYFDLWVAPVTMVFENAYDLSIDIGSLDGSITVIDLNRDPTAPNNQGREQHVYCFDCHQGEISLKATGFRMFVRAHPVQIEETFLPLQQRNGISFARAPVLTLDPP